MMPRYFLEVQYKGTRYSGFQWQENAVTIQAAVQEAFRVLQRREVVLTGSSRTDAGVHARQNYFHFDFDQELHPQFVYKINAILPYDIVVRRLIPVKKDAHARFDALSREYNYYIYRSKDPFLKDIAFYYPYKTELLRLNQAAELLKKHTDFTSFSKRNTQVKNFECSILKSEWVQENGCLVYRVIANRFLRGMVRGLTATQLKVGRGTMSLGEFEEVIKAKNCEKASFAVPAQGLFLCAVNYPQGYFG